MSRIAGRTALAVLLCLGLCVLMLVSLHQAGFTWGPSAAARQALIGALAQLPRQAAPVTPDPTVAGRDATADEAAALEKAANDFIETLRKREAQAAWEMLDPQSLGETTKEDFDEYVISAQKENFQAGEEQVMSLLMGQPAKVGEVKTSGTSGVGRVIFSVKVPQYLALVRRGGGWSIDLQSTNDLQARQALGDQLRLMSGGDFFRTMMSMQGEGLWSDYIGLVLIMPETARHEIVSRRVAEDRAVVRLEGQAELHLAVPLERTETGWQPQWSGGVRLLGPNEPLDLEQVGEGLDGPVGGPVVSACQSNLRQAMTAMLQYAQDYDERFPPADKWCTVSEPYVKDMGVFRCPAVKEGYGYAMNYKLSRVTMALIDEPGWTVCQFDSKLLHLNAYDKGKQAGASATWPPRHDNLINYSFADGHVKAMAQPLDYPFYYQVSKTALPGGPGAGPGGPPMPPPPPPPPPPTR